MDALVYNVTRPGPMGFIKGVGRMFYVINPKDTLFEREEEVPNFYVQSWPYFFMFMILEHIVLKLEGKKGLRLNDQITSVSNGLFLESGRLIWRGAESYAYTWVYSHYKLVDLPWDNVSTWVLAAIGVDFFYYWMHRACHEIHILWAQHQVHHTSEDFNMGVGIRQSVLQGWCGFIPTMFRFIRRIFIWVVTLPQLPPYPDEDSPDESKHCRYLNRRYFYIFYLPLAVAVPPAQFIMHHQFSYLYMFWIHTETIKTLGPLEYILNTPSHHRIHHGSNPYCIDVNYGGVLIIWDKLFGTFRPEKKEDRIVYGLIYQQPSFNPLHLQTFYTGYVVQRFKSYDNWFHKARAVLSRPSWKPGVSIRFKDMEEDPAIHTRPKYNVVLPTWCTLYLLSHYSLVLYGFYQLFLIHSVLPQTTVIPLVIYIFLSLTTFGMILDASPKAPLYETLRCMSILVLVRLLTPVIITPTVEFFYAVSGLFWLLFVCKSDEIKAIKYKAS